MSTPSRVDERWARLWELFAEALEREPLARDGFLTAACGDDEALRAEVAGLLAAHESAGALLDRPLGPAARLPEGDRLPAGTLLAGRFALVRLLGEGGMGAVFEALDRELGTRVAIKALRPEIADDGSALARFRREVAVAREVTHPNVCRTFDLWHHPWGDGERLVFLTMELLAGETLAARLDREGPLPPEEARDVVLQVAAGLGAAHAVGVIHRDLKSANVVLVPTPSGRRAVITDFGLARPESGAELAARGVTAAGLMIGTPQYMAPEQLLGEPASKATDIYALGLLAYEVVTGALPHDDPSPLAAAVKRLGTPPPSPRQRSPRLDASWERAIAGCLQRQPADRFRSPAEMAAVLGGAAAPWRARLRPGRRRLALAAAGAAALAVAGAWAWSRVGREDAAAAPMVATEAAGEPVWLLVAAFDNLTGEPLLEGTIEHALERDLNESAHADVVPRQRVADALLLMSRSPVGRPDADLGREVALRDGSIDALVTGRIDRVGTSYVLTADLVDPRDGRLLHSDRVEAAGQDAILPAVGRLSAVLRVALGEPRARVRASEVALAQVTTPSLRALQLYTRADAVIGGIDDAAAEDLLRQALAEDPSFASAHIHLAYAIENQRRPPADYLPSAERAMALSGDASDRERGFIRASYYAMSGDDERSMAAYQALLRLDPSHYWALGNLIHLMEAQSRDPEALPYALRLAEVAPRSLVAQTTAARALAITAGRTEAAAPYVRRGQELASSGGPDQPYRAAWVGGFPAHRLWVEGRIEEAVAAVDGVVADLGQRPGRQGMDARLIAANIEHALGRNARATELLQRSYPPRLRTHLATHAYFAGDAAAALALLGEPFLDTPAPARLEPLRIVLLARLGRVEAARRALPGIQPQPGRHPHFRSPIAVPPILAAEIALAAGDAQEAAKALARWLPRERPTGSPIYFLGADALATARRELGDVEGAIAAIEEAGRDQGRSYGGGEPFWLWVRWRALELYRELGREPEAAAVESELRRLLRLADVDFWLLRRLDGQGAGG